MLFPGYSQDVYIHDSFFSTWIKTDPEDILFLFGVLWSKV